jgi:hypothetical protein
MTCLRKFVVQSMSNVEVPICSVETLSLQNVTDEICTVEYSCSNPISSETRMISRKLFQKSGIFWVFTIAWTICIFSEVKILKDISFVLWVRRHETALLWETELLVFKTLKWILPMIKNLILVISLYNRLSLRSLFCTQIKVKSKFCRNFGEILKFKSNQGKNENAFFATVLIH